MIVKRKPKPLLIIIVLLTILFFGLCVSWIYLSSPVDKKNTNDIEVEIVSGTRTSQIGNILKEKKDNFIFVLPYLCYTTTLLIDFFFLTFF